MVDMYQVGIMVTLFLIVSGSLMAAVSVQEPGQNFGMNTDLNAMNVGFTEIEALQASLDADANHTALSRIVTQIWIGGSTLLIGARTVLGILVTALTSWIAMIDLVFAFAKGTPMMLLSLPVKAVLAFMMIFTILKFVGDMIRHLPFFGG